MDLFGYRLLTEFVTAVILLLLYSGVLWHTFRGSKFTFIYMLVTLLILVNVSLIAVAIDIKRIFSIGGTFMEIVVLVLSTGLYDLTQCVSHLLLAFKYRRVAKEIPCAIEEVQLPEAEKRCEKVLFKVLLTLNIIFPVLETVLLFIADKKLIQSYSYPRAWIIFFYCTSFFVTILQFVSGYFLI
jgi:hypothetical protein